MWTFASYILLVAFGTLAPLGGHASPVAAPDPRAPALDDRANSGGCTFTDAAAAIKSKASCTTITLSGITVPAGTTLDMTGLQSGTHVIFTGTTTFGYKEWEGPLVAFSGERLLIEGADGHVIDGHGAQWWDGKGSNGGKVKPKFFNAHDLTDSVIKNLNVKNTPVQAFSVNGATTLSLMDIIIDNSAGDSAGGHNTDGFDVGASTGVYISGATVHNQDDCLAINSGTNITFTDGACWGGHGLSIGSVGDRSANTVRTVRITRSRVVNSLNGLRIKTVAGATGAVSDVVYDAIDLSGITQYGIVVEQDYRNGGPTGKPTAGVPITGLTVQGVSGQVAASAVPVYILCGQNACSGWKCSSIAVSGGKQANRCENVPSGCSC